MAQLLINLNRLTGRDKLPSLEQSLCQKNLYRYVYKLYYKNTFSLFIWVGRSFLIMKKELCMGVAKNAVQTQFQQSDFSSFLLTHQQSANL